MLPKHLHMIRSLVSLLFSKQVSYENPRCYFQFWIHFKSLSRQREAISKSILAYVSIFPWKSSVAAQRAKMKKRCSLGKPRLFAPPQKAKINVFQIFFEQSGLEGAACRAFEVIVQSHFLLFELFFHIQSTCMVVQICLVKRQVLSLKLIIYVNCQDP